MQARSEWVFGAAEPPSPMTELRAGPVTACFDPFTAQLRYVFFGDHEAVRGIYCAVRDRHWGTVLPTLSDLRIEQSEDRFALSFTAHHRRGEIDFRWQGTIIGHPDGTLVFDCDGEAATPFETRRTGVCVLHPNAAVAGRPVAVVHSDGSEEVGEFPTLVSPDQPFFDIREIRHMVGGAAVEILFEGEVFEMEDQRNWTDDSFKTYCRPHAWPQPYRLEPGERIHHRITVSFDGEPIVRDAGDLRLVLHPERVHRLPSLGTCFSENGVNLGGHRLTWGEDLAMWTGADVLASAAPKDSQAFRNAQSRGLRPLLLGSFGNFTELNCDRPTGGVDGVSFAMNPQVHAFDTATMMESVTAQLSCLRTAETFSPGLIYVGPIQLDSRGADPRHRSLVAAAFLLGSVASLVRGSADSLTYFSEDVLAHSPAWHVLDDLLEFAYGETYEVEIAGGRPTAYPPVFGIGLRNGESWAVLLANATPREVSLRLELEGVARVLDEGSEEPRPIRLRDVLVLRPHAYVRIDLEAEP